jgi:hypothetical protein
MSCAACEVVGGAVIRDWRAGLEPGRAAVAGLSVPRRWEWGEGGEFGSGCHRTVGAGPCIGRVGRRGQMEQDGRTAHPADGLMPGGVSGKAAPVSLTDIGDFGVGETVGLGCVFDLRAVWNAAVDSAQDAGKDRNGKGVCGMMCGGVAVRVVLAGGGENRPLDGVGRAGRDGQPAIAPGRNGGLPILFILKVWHGRSLRPVKGSQGQAALSSCEGGRRPEAGRRPLSWQNRDGPS